MNRTIGIKVDVDTFAGMRSGVPVLLDIFRNHDIKASFFVPMGRDNTGRTVKRVFTGRGSSKRRAGWVSSAHTASGPLCTALSCRGLR